MSEPWIKVYLDEMRADPKISALDADQRYLLIQMWGLAKNGPGPQDELRDADGSPMTPKRLHQVAGMMTNADLVAQGDPPCKTGSYQGIKATIDRMVDLGLGERAMDGAIRFPTLLRRQGIDRTNAARQARFRAQKRAERNAARNAQVTLGSNGPVTPESTEERRDREDPSIEGSSLSAPPQKPRPRDLVWDALVEGCGYSPGTHTERGAWNKARKEIADQSPDAVAAKAAEFKRRYPDLRCTPTALVRQWGALGEANGRPRRRTMEEVDAIIADYEGGHR